MSEKRDRGHRSDYVRIMTTASLLMHMCPDRLAAPVQAFNYQSRTAESNGVPMLYVLYRVIGHEELWKRNGRNVLEMDKWVLPELLCHDVSGDDQRVRDDALKCEDLMGPGMGALMLNVPQAQVAAWKAHRTRGTYKAG